MRMSWIKKCLRCRLCAAYLTRLCCRKNKRVTLSVISSWQGYCCFTVELTLPSGIMKPPSLTPKENRCSTASPLRIPKNDSKDSFIIAQVMRFGQYSETTLSDENIVAMRQLTRFRMALVDNCRDCKRRERAV